MAAESVCDGISAAIDTAPSPDACHRRDFRQSLGRDNHMKHWLRSPKSQGLWDTRITQCMQRFQFSQEPLGAWIFKDHRPFHALRVPHNLT